VKYNDLFLKAFESRSDLFKENDTNCFRLFNGQGDGLEGISIDIYDRYILIQYFREEHLRDDFLKTEIISAIVTALKKVPVDIKGILAKNRLSHNDPQTVQKIRRSILVDGVAPDADVVVMQNGINVWADLLEGQNSGVFLDMRDVRRALVTLDIYKGAMLNLFCYTALFSTHGLCNGIENAINVDLSKTVLARARRNYELNDLHCDDRDYLHGDSWDWLVRLEKKSRQFDFIVFDPPTFSRNKKKSFSVKNDYSNSLNLINRLQPKYVLSSINASSVSLDEYVSYHPSSWESVEIFHESSDFPFDKKSYLKAGLWHIKKH
jgi:23S rRNA (cytosine1962-C5)-methyltransferase